MMCRNTANIKVRVLDIKNGNELLIVGEVRKMIHHSDLEASDGWSS